MTDYRDRLRHPKWQRRRLERMQAAEWRCESCGVDDQELHVHHLFYGAGREPWEYEDDELWVLCARCHGVEHAPPKLPPTGNPRLDRINDLLFEERVWCLSPDQRSELQRLMAMAPPRRPAA